MEDTTTTEAPVETGGQVIGGVAVDDQGLAIPQPENAEPAEAVAPETTEAAPAAQPEQQTGRSAPEPAEDGNAVSPEQLDKFAKSKGLELDSDNAKKAAEMAILAERNMHKATSRASELEKVTKITDEQVPPDATPEQRDSVRTRNVELRLDIQDWKLRNPDKLGNEAGMVSVLSDPVKKALVQEGYLSLDDVYNIAQGSNTDAVKSQGKREALESLAHKQQAAVPRGNAVNPSGMGANRITAQNVDQMVATMSVEEYRKRLPEINAAMGG